MYEQHYKRAPIIEAVIDVRVGFAEQPSEALFKQVHSQVSGDLPTATPIQLSQVGFTSSPDRGMQFRSAQAVVGLRLAAADGKRVLQIQQGGFTYSHLPPYSDWSTFGAEAKQLWKIFLDTCKPQEITRVAVRYINRIVINSPRIEPSEYLNLYAHIPPGIPQDVAGFLMQLQMPQPDLGGSSMAVVNVALDEPPAPDSLALLLDLDVFDQRKIDPGGNELWGFLDKLRDRKNELFEACITDKTRDLIR